MSGNNASRVFFIQPNAVVEIRSLTITGGSASGSSGGGILNNSATLTLTNLTVSGNSAGIGGGIFNINGGTLRLTGSTVSGNSATDGGSIYSNGTATVINSTVSGNSVNNTGGGISCVGGTLRLTNATVSGNLAGAGGGGVFQGCPVTAGNTIFANNISPNGADFMGVVTSLGNNLFETAPSSGGTLTSDMIGVDPLLGPLQNNGGATFTHALLSGSPAINAGSNILAVDSDNRRFPPISAARDSRESSMQSWTSARSNQPPSPPPWSKFPAKFSRRPAEACAMPSFNGTELHSASFTR